MFKKISATEEEFSFSAEVEILKSDSGTSKNVPGNDRKVRGIASTETFDLEQEKVLLSGISYDYFLSDGFFNDNHKGKDPEHIIGYPTVCKPTKDGLYVEGYLLKNHKAADSWWELLKSLELTGGERKAHLSIEGKILRRQNNVIQKCYLTAVSFCVSPVNRDTFIEIAKSLSKEKFCSQPDKAVCDCCGPEPISCDIKDAHKDSCACKTESEKALSAGSSAGRALTPQSLEGSPKVTTYKSLNEYSFDDAVMYLRMEKGFSMQTARAVVDAIFITNGLK